jgi:hypothetical protein
VSPEDRDNVVRTVLGEVDPADGDDSARAVASVIRNRVRAGGYGASPSEVVHGRGQFEAWSTRARELLSIDPSSKRYKQAAAVVDDVFSGAGEDPTKGSTYYFSPSAQAKLGRKPPSWAKGTPVATIGGHQFFAGPEGLVGEDILGSWGGAPKAAAAAAAAPPAGEDLLGSWNAAPAGAAPATGRPRIIITPNPPPAATAPPAGADETLPQATARWAAGARGDSWTDRSIRLGAGALRGVGDVADTLAQGIGAAGDWGAGALERVGAISPESAGAVHDWRTGINRDIATGNAAFTAAAGDSALADVGRVGGQIAGSGPFLSAGGAAVGATRVGTALAARPVLNAIATGAGAGAGTSALTSAASDQTLGDQLTTGAGAGAVLGPLGYGAGRLGRAMFSGAVNPETARLAQIARDHYGIDIAAGQMSANPTVRFLDSVLQRLPFTGYGARTADQSAAFNRAITQTFGEDAAHVTPDVLNRARTRIGQTFEDVAARTGPMPVDRGFVGDLGRTLNDARSVLPAAEVEPLANQVERIWSTVDQRTGHIAPESYQALTRRGAPLDRAMQSQNPNIRHYAGQLRNALDDLMERSAPADVVADLRTARAQWRALKTVEPLAAKSTTGDISPALVLNAAGKAYPRGNGDLNELGRIGRRFLTEPPSSGTAERLTLMHLAPAALGAAGIGGAYYFDPENFQRDLAMAGALGLAARGGSAALRSNALANTLIRRGLAGGAPNAPGPFSGFALPAAGALTFRGQPLTPP